MQVKRGLLFAALGLGVASCNGCKRDPRPNGPAGNLPPLTSAVAHAALPVAGHLDAVVSIPAGATRAMPVVIAVLGIGDTPEEQCEAWRDVVGVRAFVLCPRGAKHYVLPEEEDAGVAAAPSIPTPPVVPTHSAAPVHPTEGPAPEEPPAEPKLAPPRMALQVKPAAPSPEAKQVGFYPVDVASLDKELLAAMAALKAKYGQYVADNWVYTGFSRGAFLGASIVALHPDKFGRAVLIEGGQSAWTDANAKVFAARGGKRVLFACGQQSCLEESSPAAILLKTNKADTRVVIGQGEGHGYKKQVKEELKKNFDWVIEGDPAWAH